MRLLIISDLHIGKKARTKELCPYPEGLHKEDRLVDSFLETALDYTTENGDFDYLIIPGDITNNSNLVEYDCGGKLIDKIKARLGINNDQIIFVPGNHDVDWSVLSGVPEEEVEFRKKHKYNTLNDLGHIFGELCGSELTNAPFVKKWEFDNVIFFGFNSSWHDDAKQNKHYGQIQKEQIDSLRKAFETSDLNKLKIFVVHHHLHQFDNPHPRWIDVSVMQNSQGLINLLSEFSFNFIIHGHRHLPNFLSTTIEKFSPINILCAGSYSCEVPSDIAGYVGNLFHVIEVDDITKCKGRIKSMAYDIRSGWIESRENFGIEHISPFGSELDIPTLFDHCLSLISNSSHSFVSYNELEDRIVDLKYLPLLSRKRLFEEIVAKCNVIKGNIGDEVIFIKR